MTIKAETPTGRSGSQLGHPISRPANWPIIPKIAQRDRHVGSDGMQHLACPRTSPSLPSNAGSETRCPTTRQTRACSRGRTQSAVSTAPAARRDLRNGSQRPHRTTSHKDVKRGPRAAPNGIYPQSPAVKQAGHRPRRHQRQAASFGLRGSHGLCPKVVEANESMRGRVSTIANGEVRHFDRAHELLGPHVEDWPLRTPARHAGALL